MYAKLFTSIYQGTLRGNSHGLLVFTNLLAHCDKNGVADIHPRAIAEEVGLTVEQVRAALDVLEAPDTESRSPDEHGRRIVRLDEHRAWGWVVVNYVKYRAIRNEDDRREQNRQAQDRFRKRSKPPSAVVSHDKPQSAHTEAEAEADTSVAKATGLRPPVDNAETIFSYGVPMLVAAGTSEKHARSFLGKLRKSHGDEAVIRGLRECYRLKPMQPIEYLGRLLPPEGAPVAAHETGELEALKKRDAEFVRADPERVAALVGGLKEKLSGR